MRGLFGRRAAAAPSDDGDGILLVARSFVEDAIRASLAEQMREEVVPELKQAVRTAVAQLFLGDIRGEAPRRGRRTHRDATPYEVRSAVVAL
jgi:hypothetical protein